MAHRERSRHAAGILTPQEMGHLLSPGAHARTVGEMRWTSRKPRDVRSKVGVTVTGMVELDSAYLQMQYNTPRPWRINLAYMAIRPTGSIPVRRVCVHGNGHGFGRATHMHTYQPTDGTETCVLIDPDFPECPISTSVTNEERRMMFLAFAGLCHVSTTDLTWVDPPDDRR